MALEIDFRGETWRALEEMATAKLEGLRKKNDGQLDDLKTAHLRGRIAELKDLLTLAQPAPAQEAGEY